MVVHIHSHRGNIVLGVIGLLYAIAATALLAVYVFQTSGAAGLIDRALQLVLLGTVLTGCWFVRIAAKNLRADATGRPAAQPHRATAAA